MQDNREIVIRSAGVSDAKDLARLSNELGYSTTVQKIQQRLTIFSSRVDDQVFVAKSDSVAGWIHVSNIHSLQSEPFAEIRGLVVSEDYRHAGIGTKLVLAAENWGKNQHLTTIRVRTNVLRKQTLTFYQKCGYEPAKTQQVFSKSLTTAD